MKATVDTNVLVRMFTRDHPIESPVAEAFFKSHEIVVTNQTLCEMVWVLRRVYRFTVVELLQALNALLEARTVMLDRAAVEAGLSFLRARGDFADGVIAFEGARLGGDVYATFDRKAAAIGAKRGIATMLLSGQTTGGRDPA